MTKTTSFQTDIRPLFTERDIQGMSKAFNLGSYDDVNKSYLQDAAGADPRWICIVIPSKQRSKL